MTKRTLLWSPALIACLAGTPGSLAEGLFGSDFNLASLHGGNGFAATGATDAERSGSSVASAGDINGDGIDDLIVGAEYASPNGVLAAGKAYVIFGSASVGAGGSIDYTALDGSNGFVCNGVSVGEGSGGAVSSAGDLNNDGVEDFLIGAPYAEPGGFTRAGRAYVVFGGAGVGAGGTLDLSSLDGTNGFACEGLGGFWGLGSAVASIGDINGDDIDDIAIGAPSAESARGKTYVLFGGAGIGATGSVDLAALDGTDGFVANGVGELGGSGATVASAGDFNGDGFGDLMIGASSYILPGRLYAGATYLIYGGPGVGAGGSVDLDTLDGFDGFKIYGAAAMDGLGSDVSLAGDVNGDGMQDLIIGADRSSPNGLSNAGKSYVIFGGSSIGASGVFEIAALNALNGFVINGAAAGDRSGSSVSSAGDLNSDGFADLLIGAEDANSDQGAAFVVFGGPGVGAGGGVELAALDGLNGFTMNGIATDDKLGRDVALAGDLNNDGLPDIVLSAETASRNTLDEAGEVYVLLGKLGNVWNSPTGGDFDDPSNWLGGVVPIGGDIVIETNFGATITGPSGAVFPQTLTLGANAGRTVLDLQTNSLIHMPDDFTIEGSAGIAGEGTLATGGSLVNDGLIEPRSLTLFTGAGLSNNAAIQMENFSSSGAPLGLDLFGPLDNAATGIVFVHGDASIDLNDGMTNDGELRFAFSNAIFGGGLVNNNRVAVSSGSEVAFLDAVDDNSASGFTIAGGSTAIFFGPYTGPGIGDAGTAQFESTVSMALIAGGASFGGDVRLSATSELVVELGGDSSGDEYTTVAIDGQLQLSAGGLTVELINGYTPQAGSMFDVLGFDSLEGAFGGIALPILPEPLLFDTSQLLTTGVLRVASSCPADLNADGLIDTADLGILINAFASSDTTADINGDGVVDTADLGILIAAFGDSCD